MQTGVKKKPQEGLVDAHKQKQVFVTLKKRNENWALLCPCYFTVSKKKEKKGNIHLLLLVSSLERLKRNMCHLALAPYTSARRFIEQNEVSKVRLCNVCTIVYMNGEMFQWRWEYGTMGTVHQEKASTLPTEHITSPVLSTTLFPKG